MSVDVNGDGVLVLDSDAQCSLSVIRSLGSKDVPVTAGGHSRRSLGMVSRYAEETYVYPNPAEDREAFVRDLLAHLEQADYSVVFPVADHTTVILAKRKNEIEETGTVVGCEDWNTFEQAYDKAALAERLAPLDVPTPETIAPSSVTEVADRAEEIDYPVVIKPRCKSHLTEDSYTVTLVTEENYVDSPDELVKTYRQIVQREDQIERCYPLVQEYVPGTTVTTVSLADEGNVLAYFQEERLRTFPSSGGNSALLGAVRDKTMLHYAERILNQLGWTGPAMVEFMRTLDGEFYVIEVNGRYWGSLPFAIESGVDFPWLHYLQLHNVDPSEVIDYGDYRTDILQRRLLYEDIKWFHENLADGNIGVIVPFLSAFYGTRHTFAAREDPFVTIGALVQAAALGIAAGCSRVKKHLDWVGAQRHRFSTASRYLERA